MIFASLNFLREIHYLGNIIKGNNYLNRVEKLAFANFREFNDMNLIATIIYLFYFLVLISVRLNIGSFFFYCSHGTIALAQMLCGTESQAHMAQWYCARLESAFPSGFPGSIPGVGVYS